MESSKEELNSTRKRPSDGSAEEVEIKGTAGTPKEKRLRVERGENSVFGEDTDRRHSGGREEQSGEQAAPTSYFVDEEALWRSLKQNAQHDHQGWYQGSGNASDSLLPWDGITFLFGIY